MSLHTARRTSRPAATPAPSIVRSVVSSPGRPLDRAARAFMEPRFGRSAGDAGYAKHTTIRTEPEDKTSSLKAAETSEFLHLRLPVLSAAA